MAHRVWHTECANAETRDGPARAAQGWELDLEQLSCDLGEWADVREEPLCVAQKQVHHRRVLRAMGRRARQ